MKRFLNLGRRLAAGLLAASVTAAPAWAAEPGRLETPRGAHLAVRADFPPGPGPFPTLVLAPGAGYHMDLPVLAETAAQLLARGFAVWRFNWAYFTADPAGGRPSDELTHEREDLLAVLDRALADPRVARERVFVGGKSMGSVVAWSVLRERPAVRGAVLLTPVCGRVVAGVPVAEFDQNYPGVADERRPLLLVSGDQDPLCAPSVLYRLAALPSGPVRVAVLDGNHGLEAPAGSVDEREAARRHNAALAATLVADFVAAHAGR